MMCECDFFLMRFGRQVYAVLSIVTNNNSTNRRFVSIGRYAITQQLAVVNQTKTSSWQR